VTFQIGPDQKANQMTIEDFNDDGQGVLTRAKGAPDPTPHTAK
jgi:hypothetical protein